MVMRCPQVRIVTVLLEPGEAGSALGKTGVLELRRQSCVCFELGLEIQHELSQEDNHPYPKLRFSLYRIPEHHGWI